MTFPRGVNHTKWADGARSTKNPVRKTGIIRFFKVLRYKNGEALLLKFITHCLVLGSGRILRANYPITKCLFTPCVGINDSLLSANSSVQSNFLPAPSDKASALFDCASAGAPPGAIPAGDQVEEGAGGGCTQLSVCRLCWARLAVL